MTGDSDFAGRDIWPDSSDRDFVSWLTSNGGERFQQVAGQVDRLWVLDVDGQRLLVGATHPQDSRAEDRAELTRMVESLRFDAR